MKQNDDKSPKERTEDNQIIKENITSASIDNAHATGDGAVQKTDELLPDKDDSKPKPDTNPY